MSLHEMASFATRLVGAVLLVVGSAWIVVATVLVVLLRYGQLRASSLEVAHVPAVTGGLMALVAGAALIVLREGIAAFASRTE